MLRASVRHVEGERAWLDCLLDRQGVGVGEDSAELWFGVRSCLGNGGSNGERQRSRWG